MKLVVFGASGGVGRQLVAQAAERGHEVTAVAREGSRVPEHERVRLVRADVLHVGTFDVVAGHDVVLSSLGLKRSNPANPWSALVSPEDFCSRTARALVEAMTAHRVGRVIAVSAAGVAESAARMNWLMKFFVATSKVGVAYRDLAVMERIYAESGLDWCCPRPTRLTDGPLSGQVRTVDAFSMNAAISRADVAAWMLARAEDGRLEPRLPQLTVTS